MLFRIENFGPIKSFEMDLSKDMHLLYGKNSVGKSYAVGILYLFLKHFGELEVDSFFKQNLKNFHEYEKIIRGEKEQNINITSLIEDDFNAIFKNSHFYKNFLNGLENSMDLKDTNSGIIKMTTSIFEILIINSEKNYNISFTLYDEIFLKTEESKGAKLIDTREFFINNKDGQLYKGKNSFLFIEYDNFYKKILNKLLENSIQQFHNIYFLPASRSGLYPLWSSFGNIIAWASRFRFGMNKTIEIPTLSEHISDYFLNFSNSKNGIYKSIATEIENKILGGEVFLNRQISKIFFKSDNLLNSIELPHSGSMVSELSPLVSYLKDVMTFSPIDKITEHEKEKFIEHYDDGVWEEFESKNKKNILIIEEPEAHLHPEAQVELMKIFADMVQNSNIKLILTSHSNYMFAELGNLILGKKIDYNKVAAYHLVMTENGSVDAKDMEVTDEGILDYNFVDVSEKLYNERMELFEQFNEEVDAH